MPAAPHRGVPPFPRFYPSADVPAAARFRPAKRKRDGTKVTGSATVSFWHRAPPGRQAVHYCLRLATFVARRHYGMSMSFMPMAAAVRRWFLAAGKAVVLKGKPGREMAVFRLIGIFQ